MDNLRGVAGNLTVGTNLQSILNDLRGPWFMGFTTLGFTPSFNSDGTFNGTIVPTTGGIVNVSGTWTLTPPVRLLPVGNPQGHLTFTDSTGTVLFGADFLTNDQPRQPPGDATVDERPGYADQRRPHQANSVVSARGTDCLLSGHRVPCANRWQVYQERGNGHSRARHTGITQRLALVRLSISPRE